MSIKDFLDQPLERCTTTIVIGEPGTGKTYTILRSIEYWLKKNYFKEMYLFLPIFKYEKDNSYKQTGARTRARCDVEL